MSVTDQKNLARDPGGSAKVTVWLEQTRNSSRTAPGFRAFILQRATGEPMKATGAGAGGQDGRTAAGRAR